MKRILAVILAVLVLLTAGAVGVFAARGNKETGFTDENNDGICDNPVENVAFVDADGDGICDNRGELPCGKSNAQSKGNSLCFGKGFTDEDKDGICDNKEANNCLNGMGRGAGKGNGQGKGVCRQEK